MLLLGHPLGRSEDRNYFYATLHTSICCIVSDCPCRDRPRGRGVHVPRGGIVKTIKGIKSNNSKFEIGLIVARDEIAVELFQSSTGFGAWQPGAALCLPPATLVLALRAGHGCEDRLKAGDDGCLRLYRAVSKQVGRQGKRILGDSIQLPTYLASEFHACSGPRHAFDADMHRRV